LECSFASSPLVSSVVFAGKFVISTLATYRQKAIAKREEEKKNREQNTTKKRGVASGMMSSGEIYTRNEWRRFEDYTRNEWRRCEDYNRNEWRRCGNYTPNECVF
jgi:hypothetical protein